ncbi:MAG TPA: glutathione S-transferase family protein [Polyangiaceae bacterium]|nr:glutathione S-transferase family protein [Polyangiaceae bacterium]
MPEIILHQYELSPFSEKIRRILAYKELPWHAVRAPAIMPKPDLLALTGGYRRIPVLQVNNHVYCDTALIARVLEVLDPEPTLYPTPLSQAVAEWFDGPVFEAAAPFVGRPTRLDEAMRLLEPEELAGMVADRIAMRENGRSRGMGFRAAKAALAIYLSRLDRAAAASTFLLGEAPCIADFSAYHVVWLLDKIAPEPLAKHAQLKAWMERVAAIEGEEPTPMTSDEAIAVCRESEPWEPNDPFDEDPGFAKGEVVTVRASDYGTDPIKGTLVQSLLGEIAIRREDPRAGVVYVHFPRVGYEIARAEA